ncbi:CLUMA_CG004351, isoform A [Clunio marinus]|uniref:CLUMA_CG004351, isoform A n=1 Tax=Clunio marinus TaxID=568069 RepID=A0A1J1HSX5_9DIPT|nr:CLUMA_CG004351, isoform A [Clunio marinus]
MLVRTEYSPLQKISTMLYACNLWNYQAICDVFPFACSQLSLYLTPLCLNKRMTELLIFQHGLNMMASSVLFAFIKKTRRKSGNFFDDHHRNLI